MKIETFTEGKNEPKNEDAFGYNENTIVLSDGATDLHGNLYDGKTGGEILSRFLVEKCLESDLNGISLIKHLTKEIQKLYKKINPEALENPVRRSDASLVCVRIGVDKIYITQVLDSLFRINSKDLYRNDMLIDEVNTLARCAYIDKTGDIQGAGDYIMPLLQKQYLHQNNPDSPLGYGSLDGTEVPEEFIKTFEFQKDEVKTIELMSDGYFSIPDEATIEAYEKEHDMVERDDPYKYKKFKSLKPKDDRTIIIVEF